MSLVLRRQRQLPPYAYLWPFQENNYTRIAIVLQLAQKHLHEITKMLQMIKQPFPISVV